LPGALTERAEDFVGPHSRSGGGVAGASRRQSGVYLLRIGAEILAEKRYYKYKYQLGCPVYEIYDETESHRSISFHPAAYSDLRDNQGLAACKYAKAIPGRPEG
jgi:hypothetical protein